MVNINIQLAQNCEYQFNYIHFSLSVVLEALAIVFYCYVTQVINIIVVIICKVCEYSDATNRIQGNIPVVFII